MNLAGAEWDDSELIKAYDKAVKSWRKVKSPVEDDEGMNENEDLLVPPSIGPWVPVVVKKEKEDNIDVDDDKPSNILSVGSWVMGSPCRAVWNEDGMEYEAKIVGIEGPMCIIRFVGYGNQETKELSELKETFGKRSRDKQRRDAQTANSHLLNIPGASSRDGEDYFSSVSLTSSMYNNCPSISNGLREGREDDDPEPGIGPVSFSSLQMSPRKNNNSRSPGKRKRDDEVDSMIVEVDQQDQAQTQATLDIIDREDVLPSGAEATMGSGSSSSDLSEEENDAVDGDDEATSAPGGRDGGIRGGAGASSDVLKGFKNMVPQFPIPPMPMSLADSNGKFDFGRGQLPSLLLSWYMSGYHAGHFDAKREMETAQQSKEESSSSSKNRSKRQ